MAMLKSNPICATKLSHLLGLMFNILRLINGMDKHKKLSKHFENILFVIGCVVITRANAGYVSPLM